MCDPDYDVCAEDHKTLLILVQKLGKEIDQGYFDMIFEQISKIQHVKIEESGVHRCVWLRYKSSYSPENNEWGDFQTYRKVLGLISVALCYGTGRGFDDLEEAAEEHILVQQKYTNTLFDSRCLIFGANISGAKSREVKITPRQFLSASDFSWPGLFKNPIEPVPKSHITCDNGNDSDPFNLSELEVRSPLYSVDSRDQDFSSLPNVNTSESSKLNCLDCGDSKQVRCLCFDTCGSPTPSTYGVDEGESASSKKILVTSKTSSTTVHCVMYENDYHFDCLERDVTEFAKSLFWVLESKRLDRSFEKQDKVPLLVTPFEKKIVVGIDTDTRIYKRRCLGRMKKHIADLCLQAGLPLEALSLYGLATELLKSGQDWIWLASAYEGQCAASVVLMYPSLNRNNPLQRYPSIPARLYATKGKYVLALGSSSLPLGTDASEYKSASKSILNFDEIIEKYREAIIHYEKYQKALAVEVECSLKVARILVKQGKFLEASECLKNVVFTPLQQNEDEKMYRLNAVSEIYKGMGFHRKAAFYKWMAAMRCVVTDRPIPNWYKCYYLLLEALNGYKLPLDVTEYARDVSCGWPKIQLEMLLDLANVANGMNNQAVAVRHVTFILHTLLNQLSVSDQIDLCKSLEITTRVCEGAPVPLTLDNGMVLPPVNLINLPTVKTFKLQNLAPHLRPVKMGENLASDSNQDSIFIFSPIPRGGDKLSKDGSKLEFKWVEGDVCEVALQVFNPFPFDLNVTHMALMADGVPFESFPVCFALPLKSGPYLVNLLGTPLSSGELQILGYTTHVMGVKSNCHLRDIPAIKKPFYSIEVIPRLPQMQVTTSFPKASTFSSISDISYVVVSASATIYTGQSQECTVTLTNTGKDSIEKVNVSLHSKLIKDKESVFFIWCEDNLDTQLPIAAGSSASFTLYINAAGDFVNSAASKSDFGGSNQNASKGTQNSSISSYSGTPSKRRPQVVNSPEPFPSKTVEAVLQIRYSGGPGMNAGYCRQCGIAFTIEILPSVVITKWDVLPSEVPSHCYLVLDILNSTAHEMELTYAANKQILIEAHDICRIPVSVERCPLSAIPSTYDTLFENDDQQRKANLVAACRDHLVNLVDLKWTLSSLEVCGRASISDITWTEAMLGFILMSPIQWDIFLNRRLFKAECEFCFVVGDLITLNIKLHNVSDMVLHSLHLFVRGYQDHQNGYQSYRLETKRAVIGSEKVFVKEILPHEEYSHECGFVFFHSGVYKLDILCSHKDQGLWPLTETDSLISGKSNTSFPASWNSDLDCQMQKCAPSIDITILED